MLRRSIDVGKMLAGHWQGVGIPLQGNGMLFLFCTFAAL